MATQGRSSPGAASLLPPFKVETSYTERRRRAVVCSSITCQCGCGPLKMSSAPHFFLSQHHFFLVLAALWKVLKRWITVCACREDRFRKHAPEHSRLSPGTKSTVSLVPVLPHYFVTLQAQATRYGTIPTGVARPLRRGMVLPVFSLGSAASHGIQRLHR